MGFEVAAGERRSRSGSLARVALLAAAALLAPAALRAEPVAVAHAEGVAHGFLAVRTLEGSELADGDLIQTSRGDRVTTRLVFRFKDGSRREETTVYTQRGHFRLVKNRVVQKGPAFKLQMESDLDARTGQVRIRVVEDGGKEKVIDKHVDVPDDLANGLILVLLKNISPEAPKTTVSLLAMTPEPRLVKLEITRAGDEPFKTARSVRKALQYVVKVNVPGPAGAVASLLGKVPPDSHIWILGGEAPLFVKAESPLYSGDAIWRVELLSPTWPAGRGASPGQGTKDRQPANGGGAGVPQARAPKQGPRAGKK